MLSSRESDSHLWIVQMVVLNLAKLDLSLMNSGREVGVAPYIEVMSGWNIGHIRRMCSTVWRRESSHGQLPFGIIDILCRYSPNAP